MRKALILLFIFISLNLSAFNVNKYNITWNSPSDNAAGSMPIGNGRLGANIWVEHNGDIVFYISSTDSWSETGELFKLGRVRVSITPSLTAGGDFIQTLNLGEGLIKISGNGTSLDFFIDSENDIIYLTGKSGNPVDVKVSAEVWRDKEFEITQEMASKQYQGIAQFIEGLAHFKGYPDKIVSGNNDITVYHHNCESSYEYTLNLEKLEPENRTAHDPFIDRCFGYSVRMDGAKKISDLAIETSSTKIIDIKIASLVGKFKNGEGWTEAIQGKCKNITTANIAKKNTAGYWKKFWNKSYIEVQTPDVKTGEKINSAYTLQRWILACAGRGQSAIKFNGSIFTVDYKYTIPGYDYNPDVRSIGGNYWWLNTSIIYHSMLKNGDFDMMKPLFEQYFGNLEMMKANAKAICGTNGALSPETQTLFGTFSPFDFYYGGGEREGNMSNNPYIRRHWFSSVAMVALMLDYWNYTGDKEFVKTRIVPYAREMLTFYDSYFKRDKNGHLEISPSQSLETYWSGVVNDMPTIAGLNECVDRLKKLPANLSTDKDKELWDKLDKCLPNIPVGEVNGKKEFLPAEKFSPNRSNYENPNLYPIFPFHLCNISTDNLEIGINSFKNRIEKRDNGWTLDGQHAARLGLAKDAAENLIGRIGYSNKNFRFPAIWGPNFDWTPDQDNGCNIMITLQDMVLQTYNGKDYILPAFPKDWGVDFKLYSFGGKVVKYHKKL